MGDTPAFRGVKSLYTEDEVKKIDFEENKVKEFTIPQMPKLDLA